MKKGILFSYFGFGPSMNFIFWLWSLYIFRFLVLVYLTVWLIIEFVTSDTATSSSICHMCVFVTEANRRDENQRVNNLQVCFRKRKIQGRKQKKNTHKLTLTFYIFKPIIKHNIYTKYLRFFLLSVLTLTYNAAKPQIGK